MTDQSVSPEQGWQPPEQQPYQDRQHWFKPADALSDEQIAALHDEDDLAPALRASLSSKELPSPKPKRKGGWYTPQAAYTIEPAQELGAIMPTETPFEDEFAPPAEVEAPVEANEFETGEFEAVDTVPVVNVDEEEATFRQSPHLLGESEEGIREAPEVPLSAQLNPGLGGLRDEERPHEATTTEAEEHDESLSFEDIAAARRGGGDAIEVPQRGFGGLADQEPASAEEGTQDSEAAPAIEVPQRGFGGLRDEQRPKSAQDTGPMPAINEQGAAQQDVISAQQQPAAAQQPAQSSNFANSQQPTSDAPMSPQSSVAKRFKEVEQSVATLRQQFAQGQITRNQLENELRRLMVLDDQGRWWTLGVDSKRWYRYDGREWVPDTPPQTSSQAAVQSDAMNVPTETGVQAPAKATGATEPETGGTPRIAIDDHGMPLPQRVSVDDPGATAVNLNAVTSGVDEVTIEKPGPRPQEESSDPLSDSQAGAAIDPARADAAAQSQQPLTAGDSGNQMPNGSETAQPKQKRGLQPDYSEALGTSFTRSSVLRVGIWTGVAGVAASLGVVLCVLLAMVAYYFNTVGAYSDQIDQLPDRASRFQTAYIYGQDDSLELASFNDPNRGARTRVSLEEISPWAIHALIATEDETYYENPGFSVFAILRASYTNLTSAGPTSGASTITQQLARRLLLDEEFASELSAERKITEIILSAEISRQYSKNEILELYFNEMSFGGFTVGIEAAAQVYFGKAAAELNVYEAAMLVGLVQSPAVYDPFRNREAALGRMETVLRLMTEANGDGCIQMEHTTLATDPDYAEVNSGAQYVFDLSRPLCVTNDYLVNEVPLLKAYIEGEPFDFFGIERRYDHFTLWVWDEVNRMYGEETIFNNGFRIYTTLDRSIQDVAQQAINDRIAYASGRGYRVNNASVVVMDPQNGAVLAMVGSADFDNQDIDGEVNVAFTPQQPGSSIKPVVYLTALEGFPEDNEYWTAGTVIWDVPSTWGSGPGAYTPVNFDGRYRGPVTVRYALANSLNIPAVKAMSFTTPGQFEIVANRMGITFPLQSPQTAGLSSSLGAAEVRLIDMVAAYGAFANGGFRYEPFGITRIEDVDGNVIYDAFAIGAAPVQTIEAQYAYLISDILSDQATRADAFGQTLVVPNYPNVAAKTGTSNDVRDMWTIGWTPTVIAGIWMGNTDNSPTGAFSGSEVAAPAWRSIMIQALTSNGQNPSLDFTPPGGLVQGTICLDSGAQQPSQGCGVGGSRSEIFINQGVLEEWPQGQLPPSPEEHFLITVRVDSFTNLVANEYCPNNTVERNFLNVDDQTAINWLRNTQQGQAWARARGIDPNAISGDPPTEECPPDYVEPIAVLTNPPNAATVSQQVTFNGSVAAPNFDRYEIQFAPLTAPENWQVLPQQTFEFQHPNPNETLGFWNSTSIPDGQYRIRVVVYSTNDASLSSDPITVTVSNISTDPVEPIAPATEMPVDPNSELPSLDGDDSQSTGEAIPSGETQ